MAPDHDPASAAGEAYLEHLDLDTMDQLLGLDDGELGLLEEMLGLFKEDTPDRIVAIEHTIQTGEMAEMADVAHAVKGSAGTMGVPKVRAVAAQLEAAGRLGKSDVPPAELLEQLKASFADAVAALDTFVARKKGN
jgi:HPt (histidine-containing phosphotransfer) domain-containing protein